MDCGLLEQLLPVVTGGVIGVGATFVGQVLSSQAEARRTRRELMSALLKAADQAEDEPNLMGPLYELARLNVLGTHDLSTDLRASVDRLVRATRRLAQASHVADRMSAPHVDPSRTEKAHDAFAAADEEVTVARSALIDRIRAELGRKR